MLPMQHRITSIVIGTSDDLEQGCRPKPIRSGDDRGIGYISC